LQKTKILVLGQTPPPYHGQALMTKRLIDARFDLIEIIHVRMAFSENARDVGKASWKKVLHLFALALKVWKYRFTNRQLILYYMPAGPNKIPILRDLMLLALVRPLFSKTIFHFRASGISEYVSKKSFLFQWVCKFIYGSPFKAIQLSSLNPADAKFFSAKNIFYVPNGIEDCAGQKLDHKKEEIKDGFVRILFIAALREDKGFSVLLDALHVLIQQKVTNFRLLVMGEFTSTEYEQEVKIKLDEFGLLNHVEFLGLKTGEEKWSYFLMADFLCFPTFYDCESFGNVLIEAMMFRLPVIASNWRGIPDILTEDIGFLVPIRDKDKLAEKIHLLIRDESLRKHLGCNARQKFLKKYTLNTYLTQIEKILLLS
jgi:glycosyltransferase involved in cell wall biosynthesis